ncbi:hypothetical protein BDV25DRAFT_136329 [Aspergillus avenaceus]|uniref:Uncharacterized protein n=1 Tax=Aspergillus avenaceus TaxID=36643 RepID=A0A5N6U5T8_ASPAV|nr:hypothetical protein BDV25DRAFT_136329 [Aspergillus avenaceus]
MDKHGQLALLIRRVNFRDVEVAILLNSREHNERWRNSPPEEEACLIPDILDALKDAPDHARGTNPSKSRGGSDMRSITIVEPLQLLAASPHKRAEAALVANGLPPYLIASEARSIIPFSATSCDVQDHLAQISSRTHWNASDQQEASAVIAPTAPSVALPLQTLAPGVAPEQLSSFTQVLTLHLSRFAQGQVEKGVIPSDEMFQQEARRLLYDSEDSWNQTIADNPEWLSAFRGLYCGNENESPETGGNVGS